MAPFNPWLSDSTNRSSLRSPALYRGSFAGEDPSNVHYDFNRSREAIELRSFLEGFESSDFEAHSVTLSAAAVAVYGVDDPYLRSRLGNMLVPDSVFNGNDGGLVFLLRDDGTIRRGTLTSEIAAWAGAKAEVLLDKDRVTITKAGRAVDVRQKQLDRVTTRALKRAPAAAEEIGKITGQYDHKVRQLQQAAFHLDGLVEGDEG